MSPLSHAAYAPEKFRPDLVDEAEFELIETHISWVFLGEGEVFKVKKPLDLGFLDFTTREKRREACVAEVELNRRLAAGVYLGVVAVAWGEDGVHFVEEPDEEHRLLDWAVYMRRLDESRRADHLLEEGRLEAADIDAVAHRLAAFHAECRVDEETSRFGSPDVIEGNVRENFEQMAGRLPSLLDEDEARELEAWQLEFLDRHRADFEARARAGRVRDGHGDLRLEHVYFQGVDSGGEFDGEDLVIVDCIEFNQRFRFADVAADIAFLAMDLTSERRPDLAERLLAAYARAAGDYELYPLIDFYESYRALVRAKVASMLLEQEGVAEPARRRAREQARRYALLALASGRRQLLPPRVVAVGGWIATGKSTVAARLAVLLDAPVIDADGTRKELLGVESTVPVHERPFKGAYSEEMNEKVYAELRRRARCVLDSGRPVILDASFRSRGEREAVRRLAGEAQVDFLFVECRASEQVCRGRLEERQRGRSVSDGRLEIFDAFVDAYEEVEELSADEHLRLDTGRPIEETAEILQRRLATLPAELG